MRLLNFKDIHFNRAQAQLGVDVSIKQRLYAKYERQKKQQTGRHVLRKEMANNTFPRLFVGRCSDKSPNVINCAICKRDKTLLSQDDPQIWRHFQSKRHFLKDHRYRLDYEKFLYTTRLDEVPVASTELRAEIEKLPSAILGKKYPFFEDEVDALFDVESNVPSSIPDGGLFELVRSGGLHVFLGRLWNQFRPTLPKESNCPRATWSKKESAVIVGQMLYPQILR